MPGKLLLFPDCWKFIKSYPFDFMVDNPTFLLYNNL